MFLKTIARTSLIKLFDECLILETGQMHLSMGSEKLALRHTRSILISASQ